MILILLFISLQEANTEVQNTQTNGSAEREIWVYFQHPLHDSLTPVKRKILAMDRREDQMKQSLDHLAIAPDPEEANQLWPSSLYIRELYMMQNGTVVVDLDHGFLKSINAGASMELLMVYSMVHTLKLNFVEIESVQILVNGHLAETLLGQVDIEKPLKPGKTYLIDKEASATMTSENPKEAEQTVQNH